MNVLRRAARVVADEGFTALIHRIGKKLAPSVGEPPRIEQPVPGDPSVQDNARAARFAREKEQYEQQYAVFHQRVCQLPYPGIEHFYWYHTVDLGGGLVTPGQYDFRDQLHAFGFPENMTGMRVLDVGSATGYFAFEFERRGAEVVSVELPSLADWDILQAERDEVLDELKTNVKANTLEEADHRNLEGPFRFCHTTLGSRVKRCYSTIYDLTLSKLGGEKFDLIYAGDILLHLFSPLKALDVLTGLCRGQMITTIDVPFPGPVEHPYVYFLGNASLETDCRSWWMISPRCQMDLFSRLGFRTVSVVGNYSGIVRGAWLTYKRQVICAAR